MVSINYQFKFTSLVFLYDKKYVLFIADAEALGTGMQLHLIEADDEFGPYLIQVLWGRLISAVIYRRTEVS